MVGLGNPGPEYEGTRHNAGFLLLDYLARRWQAPAFRRDGLARTARLVRDRESVWLVKPWTYMNRSGAALGPLRASPQFDPGSHLLVIVDDVALPPGRFRLRGAGSAGGHNGLKSIESSLRRQDYARLRIGVGAKPPEWPELADWVLSTFTADEAETVNATLEPMAEAVECWLQSGIETAMNRFNRT